MKGDDAIFVERMDISARIQHMILVVCFILLCLSGFPLVFPESRFFESLFFFSSAPFELRTLLHRFAAVGLMALSLYHVYYVVFTPTGRENFRSILPGKRDLRDFLDTLRFNLGRRDHLPEYPQFNVFEKMEYLGAAWGNFIMILTGLLLWEKDWTLSFAPLWCLDVFRVVHRYEAILALGFVLIWHMYCVHFRPGQFPMGKTFLHGKISLQRDERAVSRMVQAVRQAAARRRDAAERSEPAGPDVEDPTPSFWPSACSSPRRRRRRAGSACTDCHGNAAVMPPRNLVGPRAFCRHAPPARDSASSVMPITRARKKGTRNRRPAKWTAPSATRPPPRRSRRAFMGLRPAAATPTRQSAGRVTAPIGSCGPLIRNPTPIRQTWNRSASSAIPIRASSPGITCPTSPGSRTTNPRFTGATGRTSAASPIARVATALMRSCPPPTRKAASTAGTSRSTCGQCHEAIFTEFKQSVHGKAYLEKNKDVPVCTDCHGAHSIRGKDSPASSTYPTNIATMCLRCHDKERIALDANMPALRGKTYRASYHGIASSKGDVLVANCASCHGSHGILRSSDPKSTVNPANIPETCGQCHPGAGVNFSLGKIHVAGPIETSTAAEVIGNIYIIMITATMSTLVALIGLDLYGRFRRRKPGRDSLPG